MVAYSCAERYRDEDEDVERYEDEDNDEERDDDVDGNRLDEMFKKYQQDQQDQQDPAKKRCNLKCGTGKYHAAGKCQNNGDCLCWWGWTGNNARYINGGKLNNRILADFCTRPCHFTHVTR